MEFELCKGLKIHESNHLMIGGSVGSIFYPFGERERMRRKSFGPAKRKS